MELIGEHWDRVGVPNLAAVAVVDAWLRLHESGFVFRESRNCPDVAGLLAEVDVETVAALRPDLGKRIGHAMRGWARTTCGRTTAIRRS
ncbi:hypothetical protein [Saccharothrix sp.]|uniref:hypothetical protein n=1 Tax=Saccharothrix sp. TaxID=1873460 RepID=UPI0028114622|nr:hypothetical protein [Saccharothrix sp.]